nr:ATPase domain-containing protein [Halalkalicoccus jeotgali]
MVELTATGIEGLDSILNGGLVSQSTVLVSGNPGTGKTILGIQYLYYGVREFDEPGIYLTLEEDEADIRAAAESIGFDDWGGSRRVRRHHRLR